MKRWKGLNWRGLKREVTFQEFVFTQGTILKVTTAQNGRQTELFSRYCFQTPFSTQKREYQQSCNSYRGHKIRKTLTLTFFRSTWIFGSETVWVPSVWKVIELIRGAQGIENKGLASLSKLWRWERTLWQQDTWLVVRKLVRLLAKRTTSQRKTEAR